MWRGISSDGRNTPNNWSHFHRHRFITIMNASVTLTSSPSTRLIQTPDLDSVEDTTQNKFQWAHWLHTLADVAFTKLYCYDNKQGDECPHMTSHYRTKKNVPMAKQFQAKFLPDIDGNAFSGRYLAFLRSTSVPIKATLFSEWHDSRLIPWYHFVPMQNTL